MYLNGHGVQQSYGEAMHWFRKAADQGFAEAQFNLGVAYRDGQGVPQDYAEAISWFRKAADAGSGGAQLNLGVLYANGQGVAQDFVEASKWFILAASASPTSQPEVNSKAASYREMAATNMTPEQIAEAQRLAKEWKQK